MRRHQKGSKRLQNDLERPKEGSKIAPRGTVLNAFKMLPTGLQTPSSALPETSGWLERLQGDNELLSPSEATRWSKWQMLFHLSPRDPKMNSKKTCHDKAESPHQERKRASDSMMTHWG